MAGPSQREVEAIISAKNEASEVFRRVAEDAKAAGGDISQAFVDATDALQKHGQEVNRLTEFYKTHKSEQREMAFYARGSREAVNALSFGFLALMGSQDDASESTKKLNKGMMEGFAAFQGLNFLLAGMGAGPWGMAVAAIAGVSIALVKLTGSTNDYAEAQKIANQVESDWLAGVNLPTLQRESDISDLLLSKKKEDLYVAEAKVNAQKNEDYWVGQSIEQIREQIKLANEDLSTAQAGVRAQELVVKGYKEKIDVIKQANSVQQRETGNPEALAKQQADAENAAAKARIDAFEENAALYNDEVAQTYAKEVKEYEDHAKAVEKIDADLYSKEKMLVKNNYKEELAMVSQWEKSVLESEEATEDQKTRAKQIASAQRNNITQKELDEENKQYEEFAKTAITSLTTIFGSNKSAAIAQATMNTYEAATKALTLPFPLNWIEEGLVIAAGLADVDNISKQNFAFGTPPSGFTVPAGYNNDSYKIGVSSGEKVHVTPADKVSKQSQGSVTNVLINIPTNLTKQELIQMMKGIVRDTGSTIAKLSQDTSTQMNFGNV